MPSKKNSRRTSLAGFGLVLLIVLASGTALAASGAGNLVTGDDGDSTTARGAQQPLGNLSATPPAPVRPPTGNQVPPTGGRTPSGGPGAPGDQGEGDTRGVKREGGGDSPSDSPGSGDAPGGVSGDSPAPTSGGGGDSLPFTGFLAIPVLLAGAALLIAGVGLRRRAPAS